MNERSRIQVFYDDMSVGRDQTIAADPLLRYEQETRRRAVHELLKPRKSRFILDIGCGNARDIRSLVPHTEAVVFGVDMSRGMILEGRESIERENPAWTRRVKLVLGDGCALPFAPAYFDAVVCSEVIEHVPEYSRLLQEAYRVLQQGGSIVLTTPNMHSIYGLQRLLLDYLHGRLRRGPHRRSAHPYDVWKTRSEVVRALSEVGFSVERQLGVCYLPGEIAYRLPRRAKDWVARMTKGPERLLRGTGAGGYLMAILGTK